MPDIPFTEEQKRRAASVDLEEYLPLHGEALLPSGRDKRLTSDHSITVQGNVWYDHAARRGGGPISFMQKFYHLSYPEAVTRLLDDGPVIAAQSIQQRKEQPRRPFALPAVNSDMRRLYAYLLKQRCLDREIVSAFVREGLLYESREEIRDKEYHNAVFVGMDGHGVARHAQKRSPTSRGRSFRMNVEGSDPRYSFHYAGTSDALHVFEAPIDLLSFLTLYPENWRQHSYVSLCDTSEHAVLRMLENNPQIQQIFPCLDRDEAGIRACERLAEVLWEKEYSDIETFLPDYKDWNEDLKAAHGLEVQPAEEPPRQTKTLEISMTM